MKTYSELLHIFSLQNLPEKGQEFLHNLFLKSVMAGGKKASVGTQPRWLTRKLASLVSEGLGKNSTESSKATAQETSYRGRH